MESYIWDTTLGESNESGTISIPNHEGRLESALASISPSDQPGGAVQDVEIRSFDAGWSQFRPQADACIDFVKIDVEGYELSSLKGMMKTVEKFLPVLLIEIEIRHNRSFSEVFVLLDSLGYRSYYSPDGISLVPCCSQDLQQLQTKERLDSNRQQQPKGYSRGEKRRYINNFWFVHTRSRAASHLDSLTRAREKC